jgi:hypothetical protein
MRKTTSFNDVTAHHEAGHAVVGYLVGEGIKRVVVRRNGAGAYWARHPYRLGDSPGEEWHAALGLAAVPTAERLYQASRPEGVRRARGPGRHEALARGRVGRWYIRLPPAGHKRAARTTPTPDWEDLAYLADHLAHHTLWYYRPDAYPEDHHDVLPRPVWDCAFAGARWWRRRACREAERLLRRPDVWAAVGALAGMLSERGRVGGKEATALVGRHLPRGTVPVPPGCPRRVPRWVGDLPADLPR